MNTTITFSERELDLVFEGLTNSLVYAKGVDVTRLEMLAEKLRDAETAQAERPVGVYPHPLPEDAGMALAEAGGHRIADAPLSRDFWR